jgi:lysophospholipase L1-like esterase
MGGSPNTGGLANSGGSLSVQGGAPNVGGTATGGKATGGTATGGKATGGVTASGGTGGVAAGWRIVGRTVSGTTGPRFEWSGVNISANFSGTQISAVLNDGNNKNTFEVVVDGGTPSKFATVSGQTTYQLASGLANGTHSVLVWRNTEASYNVTEFGGFGGYSSGGGLLAAPAAPAHRIEVIGDSISCGAGIEGSGSCSTTQANENDYYAYGSVAARVLGADLHTIAWSGIGMYRNYNQTGPTGQAMPNRYDYAIPTTSTAWDFTQYQPQAVVINLTSNDFSTQGDPGQPYIDAYANFVQHVRSKYPDTYFFCVIEWSTSGPDINQIVSNVKAGGDAKIEAFDIRPYANSSGCSGHPNIAGSQAMGNALAAEIKRVLGW